MVLWPTYRDESALIRLIDSKQVTRDFRGSAMAFLEKSSNSLQTGGCRRASFRASL
jgi:hypothetical protein